MASESIVSIIIRARDEASKVLSGLGIGFTGFQGKVAGANKVLASVSTSFETTAASMYPVQVGLDATTQAAQRSTAEMWLMSAAVAYAAKSLFDLAADAVYTAARTEELSLITRRMGEVHGYSAGQIELLDEQIQSLGIRTQVSRQLMANLMGSQLGLARATAIARAAQDLATLGEVESSEAAQDLAYAISSLQPRLLRRYRIYVSLVDVYRKEAAALDKTIVSLTEEERRQAFLNAVLEEAAQYTGLYEEKMRSAAGQIRSIPRYVQELKNELGEGLTPVLYGAAVAVRDLTQWLGDLPDPLQTAVVGVTGLAAATLALNRSLLLLGITVQAKAIAAVLTLIGSLLYAKAEYEKINVAVKVHGEEILKSAKTYRDYRERMIAMLEAQRRITHAAAAFARTNEDLLGGLIKSNWEWEILRKSMELARKETVQNQVAIFNLAKAWLALEPEDAISSVNAIQEAYGDAIMRVASFFGDAQRAAEDYASELLTLQRRRLFLEAELEKRGWDESLDRQYQANAEQIAALEERNQQMQKQNERMMGQMLMSIAQTAGLSLSFILEIGKAYGIVTEQMIGKAGLVASIMEAVKTGIVTETAGIAQLRNIPTGQHGLVVPGPVGQPRLVLAHGGETIVPAGAGGGLNIYIGSLYGTDRQAAMQFSRNLAKELRAQGVITR